jgi:hypothetical protein
MICDGSWKAAGVPLALNFASIGLFICSVLEVYWLGLSATGIAFFIILVYPAWISENAAAAVQSTTYALSVGTTTTSTIIIVTRILLVTRMPGTSKKVHLVVEIITESAALYTLSALIYIGMIHGTYYGVVINTLYAGVFFGYMAVCSPANQRHKTSL